MRKAGQDKDRATNVGFFYTAVTTTPFQTRSATTRHCFTRVFLPSKRVAWNLLVGA